MAGTSLFFDIFGRDHGVGTMLDNVGGRATGMGNKFKAVGVAMGAGLLALGGAVLHTGLGELSDWSAGNAQLEAGIKSTNNAANVSVQGMQDLASAIQDYSGQTDDSIVAAESLLLTFTNIRNVGPDKIFDLATKSAADMAAKLGGDAASQSILLGKALNDPIKGITALTRVGVSFTAGQRAQIKAMQESGNVIGAQKLILGELTTEFGGAAAAAGDSLPGQVQKAHRAFEDLSQGLLTALMPALIGAAQMMTGVAKWAGQNQGVVMALAIVVGVLAVAFIVLSTAVAVAASPFIWVGLAIAALVAGVIIAYNQIGWFKDGVNAVFGFIVRVVTNVVNFIATYMVPIWVAEFKIIAAIVVWLYTNVIQPYISFMMGVIKNIVLFIMGTMVPGFQNAFRFVQVFILAAVVVFNQFRAAVGNVVGNVIGFISGMVGNIGSAMNYVGTVINVAVSYFLRFASGVAGAIGDAIGYVSSLPGRILGALGGLGGLLWGAGSSIINGFLDGLRSSWGAVTDFIGGIASWIAAHKGPIDVDKKLLVPAGTAIMGGFGAALRASMPGIVDDLQDFTADIGAGTSKTVTVARQISNVKSTPQGQVSTQLPPIYIQNPFTGEYLLAKVDERVDKGIGGANDYSGRRPSR